MRYIIAPLDMNTEQREVYWLLYNRMNFESFQVKYTLEQLSLDSNSKLELTKKKVSKIVKDFVKEGYLEIIRKGVKGKPTVYKIVKIKEQIGNESVTNKERIGTNKERKIVDISEVTSIKGTNKERIGTNKEQIGNESVTPFNDIDIDKEKDNIYNELFSYYLSLKLTNHKSFTGVMKRGIDKAIKENKYTLEEMKVLLERHEQVVKITKNNDNPIFKRNLDVFFGQKIYGGVSLICTQYEEGGTYYEKYLKNKKIKPKSKPIERRFE